MCLLLPNHHLVDEDFGINGVLSICKEKWNFNWSFQLIVASLFCFCFLLIIVSISLTSISGRRLLLYCSCILDKQETRFFFFFLTSFFFFPYIMYIFPRQGRDLGMFIFYFGHAVVFKLKIY